MRAALLAVLASAAALCTAQDYTVRQVVYGKYFSNPTDGLDTTDQTYWLFSPKNVQGAALPVHIQVHGGGFTGGAPSEHVSAEIEAYVAAGFHYMSVGYRLVATKYWYHAHGGDAPVEEASRRYGCPRHPAPQCTSTMANANAAVLLLLLLLSLPPE